MSGKREKIQAKQQLLSIIKQQQHEFSDEPRGIQYRFCEACYRACQRGGPEELANFLLRIHQDNITFRDIEYFEGINRRSALKLTAGFAALSAIGVYGVYNNELKERVKPKEKLLREREATAALLKEQNAIAKALDEGKPVGQPHWDKLAQLESAVPVNGSSWIPTKRETSGLMAMIGAIGVCTLPARYMIGYQKFGEVFEDYLKGPDFEPEMNLVFSHMRMHHSDLDTGGRSFG